MLNMISDLDAAADARAGSGLGACLPYGDGTVKPESLAASAFARPRAAWDADVFGPCRNAADLGPAAGQGQASSMQSPSEQHTTRITAANGGGAVGPHPARDPV